MDDNWIIKSNRCNLDSGRPKDLGMWAAADWKGASWIGTVLSEGLSQSRSRPKKRTWSGLIMTRNYKRLGGIINASVGPAKALAVFAESFGILRKNVVNLRKNPVSSLNLVSQCQALSMWSGFYGFSVFRVNTCIYNVLTRIYMYLPEKLKSHRILTTWTEPDQIRDNCV